MYTNPMEFNPDRFIPSEGRTTELTLVSYVLVSVDGSYPVSVLSSNILTLTRRSICPGSFLSSIYPDENMSLILFLTGLHLADASVFISCAMSLAVFDISKCVENGVVVEPLHEQTSGTIRYIAESPPFETKLTFVLSHPKPFKCDIKPRSHKAVSLIQADEMM